MSDPVVVKPDGDLKVVSDKDLQMYYFTLTNTLKNYKLYKYNTHLFNNTFACDRCYQLYSIKEPRFLHNKNDIVLCEHCLDNIGLSRDNYNKVDNSVNHDTGLRYKLSD